MTAQTGPTKQQQYVALSIKKKQIEEQMKQLADEIQKEMKDKEVVTMPMIDANGNKFEKNYNLTKVARTTYKVKETVDTDAVYKVYPSACTVKVDAKMLYKIAAEPDTMVEVVIAEHLQVKEEKVKETPTEVPDF